MVIALSSPALDASQPTADLDDEPAGPLSAGLIAGRYQVIRELGAGGMGIVYLAYDKTAARNVALKRMSSIGSGFRERFRREYRALAAVRHRGVPAIYDIGNAEGPYFTMEIIAGETIRDLLKRGPIKPTRAVALAIDLGRVLMAVHAVGVIHRDVKPTNIIVEDGDRVRLIDFGACLLTPDYYKLPHLRDITAAGKRWHTADHEFIGCAPYTCPQYWSEGLVAPQSDVFSVCVVLYEMLTGRGLYSEAEGFRKISADEFPSSLAPLVAELERGLADADERHATMADLVRTLEIVRSKMLTSPRVRGVAAPAVSFVLGAAVAVSVLLWGEDRQTPASVAALADDVATIADAAPEAEPAPEVEAAPEAEATTPTADAAIAISDASAMSDEGETALGDSAGSRDSKNQPSSPRHLSEKPQRPATWDERLRKAEKRARRCLEKAGLAVSPRLTTIAAGEPARIRGVASDSREAGCIRDALDRFDVRVAEGQRQHTFFAR